MADHTYTGQAPKDGANKKFMGVAVDNAGDTEFVAVAGGESFDLNGETVAPMSVQVSLDGGAGETIGSTTAAAVHGDNNGSLSAKLRGLLMDIGGITDLAISGSNDGTLKNHLRFLALWAAERMPGTLGRLAAAVSFSTAWSTEDKAVADAIKTAVEVIDNAIAGSEMQIDVVGALPAGTNNIGDVDIASAIPAGNNNIGDVDIASALPAGTNNIGDVDVLTLPALPAGSNNIGDVDIASVPKVASGTLANVASSATTVQLRASTAGRLGLIVYNDADVSLYLKYGATASLTSFTAKIPPHALWEMPQPIYTGVVDGIWDASPTGAARVTEV